RQHDQPRHDERAVGHALDARHARPDRGAEDDEIERGRDDRRDEALPQSAAEARHLELVDRGDRVRIHLRGSPACWGDAWTRLTKMSWREVCFVCRSLTSMPGWESLCSNPGIPVRSSWASYVYSRSVPPLFSASGHCDSPAGTEASGSMRCTV